MKENILVINPGSTSTKIALFNLEAEEIASQSVNHSTEELSQFKSLLEQGPIRKKIILDTLKKENIDTNSLKALIGRGGILKPLAAGTYTCLLYTSDAADEEDSVDLGGRRIIKKKKKKEKIN